MKYLVLAALSVLLTACGSESDKTTTSLEVSESDETKTSLEVSESDETTTFLEGSWRSEQTGCVDYDDDFTVFGYAVFSFNGNAVHITGYTFADEDCTQARSKTVSKGTLAVLNDVILASGETVTQIKTTLTSSQEILYLASAVETYNTDEECGFTNWEINVSKDTLACVSTELFKDIAKIEGNQLIFGDEDYLGEDGYPTQLYSDSPWYKQ